MYDLVYLNEYTHLGKESSYNAGDPGSTPESEPGRREWLPTPVFLPGEFHGQRSLVGFSLWGHIESDTTEQLTFSLFFHSSSPY